MKMRKVVTLALCVAMACTVFAGGKKETAAPAAAAKEPAEISGSIIVLHHRTDFEDQFEAYRQRFNAVYPKVTVEFEAITDYAGTVRTRMSTQEYGDVLMMVTTPPVPEDFSRYYEPLGTTEELFAKYDFLESNAQCYYGGYVYGLPINANTGGLLYNKDVFKKAGITSFPKSSEEFYTVLDKIKRIQPQFRSS